MGRHTESLQTKRGKNKIREHADIAVNRIIKAINYKWKVAHATDPPDMLMIQAVLNDYKDFIPYMLPRLQSIDVNAAVAAIPAEYVRAIFERVAEQKKLAEDNSNLLVESIDVPIDNDDTISSTDVP